MSRNFPYILLHFGSFDVSRKMALPATLPVYIGRITQAGRREQAKLQ